MTMLPLSLNLSTSLFSQVGSENSVRWVASVNLKNMPVSLMIPDGLFNAGNVDVLNRLLSSWQENYQYHERIVTKFLQDDIGERGLYFPDGRFVNSQIIRDEGLLLKSVNLFENRELDRQCAELWFYDSAVYGEISILACFKFNGEFVGAEFATW